MRRIARRSSELRGHRRAGLGVGETLALGMACLAFLVVTFVVFEQAPRVGRDVVPASASYATRVSEAGLRYRCENVTVVDGDTLRCRHRRVRLASIDAPEMPGHCRAGRACVPGDPVASAGHLRDLIGNRAVECREVDIDAYSRSVAFCTAGGVDLSCGQVRAGAAIVRYGELSCG